jgi:hypothetical protein
MDPLHKIETFRGAQDFFGPLSGTSDSEGHFGAKKVDVKKFSQIKMIFSTVKFVNFCLLLIFSLFQSDYTDSVCLLLASLPPLLGYTLDCCCSIEGRVQYHRMLVPFFLVIVEKKTVIVEVFFFGGGGVF